MRTIQGLGASDGIAFGPAYRYLPELPPIEAHPVERVEEELRRLDEAVANVERDLAELLSHVEMSVGQREASIFDAHRMFLSDPVFIGRTKTLVSEERINAEAALKRVTDEIVAIFEAMKDEYFRQRATDVVDVCRALTRVLLKIPQPTLESLQYPCVVMAGDLTPSDTARMDRTKVLGFCTARGGRTGHAAILARCLGIPAVVGAGPQALEFPQDIPLILDGETGVVIAEPDSATVKQYEELREANVERRRRSMASAREQATTTDGQHVEVLGNIGGIEDVDSVIGSGGQGVGLLRTEFLYMNRTTPPDEEEQTDAYRAIAEKLGAFPLTVRTLDVGGDKPLPFLPMQAENNPFLGLRGVRLCLTQPDFFKVQLRAILRAAHGHRIRAMFPMVASVEEVRAAKDLLDQARTELDARGIPQGDIEIGIMIETPAAALSADILAREVDFFSIGTNDLTQYTLAVDRTNALVQGLANALHPAVLRLIELTVRKAHEAGIVVGLCGELAGDPGATPLLLGLGVDEFSMAAGSIPLVKEAIRRCRLGDARQLAADVLELESTEGIECRLQRHRREDKDTHDVPS